MNLQTKIQLEPEQHQIIYDSKILLLGSCFVENIGSKLDYFKFQTLQNPFGVLFNPIVIERLVSNAVSCKEYSHEEIFFYNERWHSYDTHSELSHTSKEAILYNINTSINTTKKYIQEASHIVITLGTAWVYKHKNSGKIVANCHKVPQKEFDKELLSVETITKSLGSMVSNIQKVNQQASIIFTVSPVRHLKDGFIENQQSKSHLITAIHQFLNQKSKIVKPKSYYFPSYEIMMDELRDYRFYAEDMLHPNSTAINYIWKKFKDVWINVNTIGTMRKVDVVQKGLMHKPLHENSLQYQVFLKDLNAKIKSLKDNYTFMKF